MTEKTRALYAGGALGALIVGALAAKLVLLPADKAASRPAMHAVASFGAPDAFGSAGGLSAVVTLPSAPPMASISAPVRSVARTADPPAAAPSAAADPPGEEAEAALSAAQDAAAVAEPAQPDSQPGRSDSAWGRRYAPPPESNGHFAWRRPAPSPRRAPHQPPRYAWYGPPPEAVRPWDGGPPPGADFDAPD